MRIFITSIPDELQPCQHIAIEAVRQLGHEPVLRTPVARRGLDPLTTCDRQVALSDTVLAIVGWRCGPVLSPTLGGDGLRPWSAWEVKSAFDHGLPVVVLLAGEGFAPELREELPEARAFMEDFRGELTRLAVVFETDSDFCRLTYEKLSEATNTFSTSNAPTRGLKLRRWPPPELPTQPYPLLLPYTHPDLMAGRNDDIAALRCTLDRPVAVVGLYAASGTGKSSLLAGGLVPALRDEGRPVAFERHPAEPGFEVRLLADLIESKDINLFDKAPDARTFVDKLVAIRHLADGLVPVLVIDQFEDLFQTGTEQPRARLGTILAASVQRLPELTGPPCRWLLSYRQEYHGQLVEWLEDVLRDARALAFEGIKTLPHDLSGPSRFMDWPLAPLAAKTAGLNASEAATQVFLEAIEKPLASEVFPWTFPPGHAERLARAFGEARARQPEAPLVPELQVVLAHLLRQAGEAVDDGPVIVRVPDAPAELIDQALEEHLRQALDFAFPHNHDGATKSARTRALLILRELADAHWSLRGRYASDALARAIGGKGQEILEKFTTSQTRIVLREQRDNSLVYVLSHDRLADVLVRVVDEGRWALEVDTELLGLRRFVELQCRLYETGDVEQATLIPTKYLGSIEANQEVLLWEDEHQLWWNACRMRRNSEHQRRLARLAAAVIVVMSVILGAWKTADSRNKEQALFEDIASGKPVEAFMALNLLTMRQRFNQDKLLDRLREREYPFDVFERGLGGVSEEHRTEALVRVAEIALPILEASPEDPVMIASLIWALDFFGGQAHGTKPQPQTTLDLSKRRLSLRNEALSTLRRNHPPPPLPITDYINWVDIPAGTFWIVAESKAGFDAPKREARHANLQVTLSHFRISTHEVTNAEYRRLVPDHQGEDNLPAGFINWYEAYTYAAWLGGRLPTEWEWEYAAKAGCRYQYCKTYGREADLSEVAWWLGNSVDEMTLEPSTKPVKQLAPNPWGLWDVYGNVVEWNANWYSGYSGSNLEDPSGPTKTAHGFRAYRGGSAWDSKKRTMASLRTADNPNEQVRAYGFRVVLVD